MMDAARNALLKILEEPPEQTTFVLTTSRRQAIIPTILSRLRPYRFVQRDAAAARQVLVRVFRIDQREPDLALDTSIGDYFAQHRGGAMETVTLQARRFLLAVLAERHDDGLVLDGQPLAAGASAPAFDAGPAARAASTADAVSRAFVGQTVAQMEKTLILDTLSHCLGNRTHAANILGISIRTLRNKLNEYADEGTAIPAPQSGVAASGYAA